MDHVVSNFFVGIAESSLQLQVPGHKQQFLQLNHTVIGRNQKSVRHFVIMLLFSPNTFLVGDVTANHFMDRQ